MPVAQLDIGNSHLKWFVYDVLHESQLRLLGSGQEQTPLLIESIVGMCKEFIVRMRKFSPDALMVTSHGNAVVVGDPDDLMLHQSLDSCKGVKPRVLPYADTGFSKFFPGIGTRLAFLASQGHEIHRPLPLSGYVASALVENQHWQGWDWTHASNSGNWHQVQQTWHWPDELGKIECFTCSPTTRLGLYEDMQIFLGGHEISFISAIEQCAFITTGTYTIVSVPKSKFCPVEDEQDRVRWIRDASGELHKQMCLPTQQLLETVGFHGFAQFLTEECTPDVPVYAVGVLAQEAATNVESLGHVVQCSQFRQYEQVALLTARLL